MDTGDEKPDAYSKQPTPEVKTTDERGMIKLHHKKHTNYSGIPVQTIKQPGVEIEGVVKLSLSVPTQMTLNCIAGDQATIEMPWIYVCKNTAQEMTDFLPIAEDIKETSGDKLLIGYDTTAHEKTQFFVCVTEHAEHSVLDVLDKIKQQRIFRIRNSITRKTRHWNTLGSEDEVDATIVKNSRPLFELEAQTTISKLRSPAQFSDHDAHSVKDVYVKLGPPRNNVASVEMQRISTAVQVIEPYTFTLRKESR